MIISHKHKYVFLGIPKTGSTTCQASFHMAGLIGPEDLASGYDGYDYIGDRANIAAFPGQNILGAFTYSDVTDRGYEKEMLGHPFKGQPHKPSKIVDPIREKLGGRFREVLLPLMFKVMTPKELVNVGALTEDQLFEYNVFGFLRDPIDRFLSGYFQLTRVAGIEPSIEHMAEEVDSIDPEYGPLIFSNKKYRDYFTYEGKKVINAVAFDQYKYYIRDTINQYGGQAPDPLPRFKSNFREEWSRKPIDSWMPKETKQKLEHAMKDDIEFYNER